MVEKKSFLMRRAFTLAELIIVVGIIGMLTAIVVPTTIRSVDNARISKVLSLVSVLEIACEAYRTDTNGFAREFAATGGTLAPIWNGLSLNDGAAGWNGPYIRNSLTAADNPFGGMIQVHNNLVGTGFCRPNGFDLNGDGTPDRTGQGNFLCLFNVPEVIARRIDARYDRGLPPGGWRNTGRVEYSGGPRRRLLIYLTGG